MISLCSLLLHSVCFLFCLNFSVSNGIKSDLHRLFSGPRSISYTTTAELYLLAADLNVLAGKKFLGDVIPIGASFEIKENFLPTGLSIAKELLPGLSGAP